MVTGLSIPQQYVCLSTADLVEPMTVHMNDTNDAIDSDVTATHVFVGYKPVIIAIPISAHHPSLITEPDLALYFRSSGHPVAKLRLRKLSEIDAAGTKAVFYEGVDGSHMFLSSFHQLTNRIRESVRKSPVGNVSLNHALHDQVRIAYSVPRVIGVIQVVDRQQMNVFPTDLHGQLSTSTYVSSLRIGGKAEQQVRETGKIVLSIVPAKTFEDVYALGKNHMRDMRPVENFEMTGLRSRAWNVQLAFNVVKYYELEVIATRDVGIHRIFIYRIVSSSVLSEDQPLTHVHQFYAQWRHDRQLETPMLIRTS